MTDINFIKFGSTSIPLGKITRFEASKTAQLTVTTLPITDSGGTEAYDALGIAQYINITGIITGDFNDLQSIIIALKSKADGAQIDPFKLQSPFVCAQFGVIGTSSEGYNLYSYVKGTLGSTTQTGTNKLIDDNISFLDIGTVVGDKVKNLITGEVAEVASIDDAHNITLTTYGSALTGDIFQGDGAGGHINTPYALTATIWVKMLSFSERWELPGINYVEYNMGLVQTSSYSG